MTDFTLYRGIGNSISRRASLLTEMTARLALHDQEDTVLCEKLLARAPENLREWLAEEIMMTLFKYGRCDDKINFDNEDYGFGDLIDIRTKMKALQEAWEDVVTVTVDDPERDRVEIWIRALL